MSAPSIIEILQHFDLVGLNPDALMKKVMSWSTSTARSVSESLTEALGSERSSPKPPGVLDFFAASPIRGDACQAFKCQTQHLDTLARYTALYADRVVVPLDFWLSDDKFDGRWTLCRQINIALRLRPLIQAGLVLLVPSPALCVCTECLAKEGVDITEVQRAARDFFEGELLDLFKVIYRPPENPDSEPTVEVQGPVEYLPHGPRLIGLQPNIITEPKRLKLIDGEPGALISKTTIRRERLLSADAFGDLIEDFIAQRIFKSRLGTTYLTDSPGQARFLGTTPKRDSSIAKTANLCAHLAHSVPAFANAPLDFILKLREDEGDAFIRYRAALNGIARDYLDPGDLVTETQAVELYHDVLRPRLAELNILSKQQLRTAVRKTLTKVSFPVLRFRLDS